MPIVVGAIATVLLHLPVLTDRKLWMGVTCFCGCSGGLVGILPAFLAARRDAAVRAGQGFTVAFIAVGLGAFVVAAGSMLFSEMPAGTRADFRDAIDEVIVDSGRELTAEERREMLDAIMSFAKYAPVTGAIMLTVCAGVVGALTAFFINRRQPPAALVPDAGSDRWTDGPPDSH